MLHKRFSTFIPAVLLAGFCCALVAAQPTPPRPPRPDAPPPPPAPPSPREIEIRHMEAADLAEMLEMAFDGQPRAQIGIALGRVGDALAAQLGIDPQKVVLVMNIAEGQPADEAGLQQYDIITQIDGVSPITPEIVRRHVRDREPGDEITLHIIRAGKEQSVVVTLGEARLPRWIEQSREEIVRESAAARDYLRGAGEQYRVRADEARAFLREHRPQVQRHMQRLREEGMLLREALERDWMQLRENLEVDEETIAKVREALERAGERTAIAIERAMEAMQHGAVEIDVSAPRVQFRREDGGRGMIVHAPEAPRAGFGADMIERRVRRMEERLERIERMLEQLTESEEREE